MILEISKLLMANYMPYAKGTIIDRAIPAIDGLKPSNRKILYTMFNMGLLNGNKTKSSNIVGQTMKLHPHGDASIYESMVRMTTGNEALNLPYVESKGNFGKAYSRDLAFAAPRYTEAKLTKVCAELFDGINEDAVDFKPNFDDTTEEPVLLPVKFPSILVNTSSGIAVGTSSSIPSFGLKEVCDATVGILEGNIKNASELMDVLGVPKFTTGGYVHASKADLVALGKTGRASLTVSGSVSRTANKIIISEIPYGTTIERIIEDIEENVKSGDLKEIADVVDGIDLNGFKVTIELKKTANSAEVLKKLCRLTDLRMKMSFITRVIIDEECKELGLLDLLNHWIYFRLQTVERTYKHRKMKKSEQEHLLEAWEKIQLNIKEVAQIIANRTESEAKDELKRVYNLDDVQVNHILDMRIKMFTQDNLGKRLGELTIVRSELAEIDKILSDRKELTKVIIDELQAVRDKYGVESKTVMADPIREEDEDTKEKIDDSLVSVILTKNGYLKRSLTTRLDYTINLPEDDDVDKRWLVANDSHILVFTYSGYVHKILVDSIECSRGIPKDKISNILHTVEESDIMYIDVAGNYSGYFNLVYSNGRGCRVNYSCAAGNRAKYKANYEETEPGRAFVTKDDKFFLITRKRKAAYSDISDLGKFSSRVAFKVARIESSDSILGIQPEKLVPDMSTINLEKYTKGYCVSIGADELWATEKKATAESEESGTNENQ